MNQQDSNSKKFIIIHSDGRFFRGYCSMGGAEWTRNLGTAKTCSVNDAIGIQLNLRNKGYTIFVDNFEKYLPTTEV